MTKEEFQEALWEEIKKQSKNDWFQIDLKQEVEEDPEFILGSIVYNNYCLVISNARWNGSCYALDGVDLRVFDIRNFLYDEGCFDSLCWDEAFEYLYSNILVADDWDNPLEFKKDKYETATWYICKTPYEVRWDNVK